MENSISEIQSTLAKIKDTKRVSEHRIAAAINNELIRLDKEGISIDSIYINQGKNITLGGRQILVIGNVELEVKL